MYLKHESIRYEKDIDLADTFKFDEFPETGLSAGLLLTLEAPTNSGEHYSADNYDDKLRLIDWINKVQIVVDGKRPLKDLSGAVAQALEYWNVGRSSPDYLKDPSIGPDRCFIPISWGRFLGDTEYCLDWSKYASLELDLTNIATDGPIDSLTLNIENLKIMDPAPGVESKGVFQERIWREYTTAQNKTEYFKPPVGNKIRRIILRCVPDLSASAPWKRIRNFDHLAYEIKLGFKDYSEIAFDGYGESLMEQNMMEFPHMAHTSGYALALTGGYGVRTGIGYRIGVGVSPAEIATSLTERNFGIYPYSGDVMNIMSDTSTNAYLNWWAKGFGYNNTLALLFDLHGPEHFLDTVDKGPVNLDIKTEDNANAADGVVEIILSELVDK